MKDLLINFALPILTALIAWFGNAYRNKQKKESDMLDNVKRIVNLQDDQIKRQDAIIERYQNELDAAEIKTAHDRESIKQAYVCKHPSEECPVLQHDALWVETECSKNCAMCDNNKSF